MPPTMLSRFRSASTALRLGLAWVLVLSLVGSLSAQQPAPTSPAAAMGSVVITCTQPDAMVFVDHTMVGKAPIQVNVAPGEHEIRISIDDRFMPFVQVVTVQAGERRELAVTLQQTSQSLFDEGLAAFKAGDVAKASSTFTRSAEAPGKRPAEIPFYLGLIAQGQRDLTAAEKLLVAFVGVKDSSAVAHYHLGCVREALGQEALAATAFKSAVTRGVGGASALLATAGSPSFENIERLQKESSVPGREALRIQLAYLLELKGSISEARAMYRKIFETVVEIKGVDTRMPFPTGLPVALAMPEALRGQPADPANTMYVTSDDAKAVAAAWKTVCRTHPTLGGKALVGSPRNHWVPLQAQAFDRQDVPSILAACSRLSGALATDVIYLMITRDGRAWYFLHRSGRLVDRYCSNPGRPDEVDYRTLRSWAGRPDLLVSVCRGEPLSARGPGTVTITDLNAVLYFYYPEMRVTRPASYRSPGAFMKVLSRLLGVGFLPSRYAKYPAGDAWKGFRAL